MNQLVQLRVASLANVSGFDNMLNQPPKDIGSECTPQWGETKLRKLRFALVTLVTARNAALD